jgi:amino acid transporter
MEIESDEGQDVIKPTGGRKLVLGISFIIGLGFTLLLTFVFLANISDLKYYHNVVRKVCELIQIGVLLASAVTVMTGAVKMWSNEKKGWGFIFCGASILGLVPLSIILGLFITKGFPNFYKLADFLILITVILVCSFLGFVSIFSLSPQMRKIPTKKEMAFGFIITGCLSVLIAAAFLIDYFYSVYQGNQF